MIAVAIASVPCTITGEIAFGRMCEKRIARRRTPTARAASTKSFSRCASTEPRSSRAKIGTFVTPTAIMICQSPGPSIATIPIASSRPGIASMTSISAHDQRVDEAADVARDRAEHEADREPDRDRDDADEQREAGAVEDPRELVAAELVDAEPGAATTGRGSSPPADRRGSARAGRTGAISGAKIATTTNGADEAEADDRARVPAQPAPGVAPEAAGRRLELDLDGLELGDAHENRIRGLMIAYEMSTIRLTRTKTIARKRIPPWSTG